MLAEKYCSSFYELVWKMQWKRRELLEGAGGSSKINEE